MRVIQKPKQGALLKDIRKKVMTHRKVGLAFIGKTYEGGHHPIVPKPKKKIDHPKTESMLYNIF